MRVFSIVVLLLALTAGQASAQGGGSVELGDAAVVELVKQQPATWAFLTQSLDIYRTGSATRLPSGHRVAPYEFFARVKGAKGAYGLRIVITADVAISDDKGKKVERPTKEQ